MVVGDRVVAPKPPGGEFPNHRPGNKVRFPSNNNASVWLRACQKLLLVQLFGNGYFFWVAHKTVLMV